MFKNNLLLVGMVSHNKILLPYHYSTNSNKPVIVRLQNRCEFSHRGGPTKIKQNPLYCCQLLDIYFMRFCMHNLFNAVEKNLKFARSL